MDGRRSPPAGLQRPQQRVPGTVAGDDLGGRLQADRRPASRGARRLPQASPHAQCRRADSRRGADRAEHGEASSVRDRRRNPAHALGTEKPSRDDGQALDRCRDDPLGAGAGRQGLPAPLRLQDRGSTNRAVVRGRTSTAHRDGVVEDPDDQRPAGQDRRPGRARTGLRAARPWSVLASAAGELPRPIGPERGRPPCPGADPRAAGLAARARRSLARDVSRTWSAPACSTPCRRTPTHRPTSRGTTSATCELRGNRSFASAGCQRRP